MKTIQVQVPEGFEAHFDNGVLKVIESNGKKVNGPVTDRIKTVKDIIEASGMTQEEFEDTYQDLDADERAYILLKRLAIVLNEGWTPDWKDSNQGKYYPWFEMAGSSGFRFVVYGDWGTRSSVGSRLCFKSRELAEYAGRTFTEVYKDFMVID